MDFVDGLTLTEWLVEHPDATVTDRIALLRTVAAALDEMHSGRATEVPVAHGDVKPANIILKPDGGTVLVDFGLARLSDATGIGGWTNPYAAPELRYGRGQATPESDAFALGATLAHLLIGHAPPVDGNGVLDLPALEGALNGNPLTHRRPAVVRRIMTAMAARPEQRPQNLSEWIGSTGDALSQVTSDVPAGATFIPMSVPLPTGPTGALSAPPPFFSAPPVTPGPFGPGPAQSDSTPTPGPPPARTRRKDHGPLAAIVAAVLLLATAAYAAGAITQPAWATGLASDGTAADGAVADGQTATVTQNVPGATVTETDPGATMTQTVAGTTATVTQTTTATVTAGGGGTSGPAGEPTVARQGDLSLNLGYCADLNSTKPDWQITNSCG